MKEQIRLSYDSARSAVLCEVRFLIKDGTDCTCVNGQFDSGELQEDGSRILQLNENNLDCLIQLLQHKPYVRRTSGS
jgi:hypothetical protein